MSEDEMVAALAGIFEGASGDVPIGIGDDAAVLASCPDRSVVSVDASVEGVHFRFGYGAPPDLGRRAFLAAISDLAAMGATPRAALISLALPPTRQDEVLAMARGIARAATSVRCEVVGGNVSRASEVSIHTTVIGNLRTDTALTRSGARAGDSLWVTGTLGTAALGLRAIQSDKTQLPILTPFVERWQQGRAQLTIGASLLGRASACLDVSDGLLLDAERLARASSVMLEIDPSQLPLHPSHAAAAALLGHDALSAALSGGEDYELLFTASADQHFTEATCIGRVLEPGDHDRGRTVVLLGQPTTLRAGHDHFR